MVIIIDLLSSLCCIECDVIEVDVKCMHTISGGHGLSGFRDTLQGRRWEIRNGGALYACGAREKFFELIKIHDGHG